MAVFLQRTKQQAMRTTTTIRNRISRPSPWAAFSPTLNKWNPDSLKASFIWPSISASSFASSWVWIFAVGENRVLPIVKQIKIGAVELEFKGLQVRMLDLSVVLVVVVIVVEGVVEEVVEVGLGEVLVTKGRCVGLAM